MNVLVTGAVGFVGQHLCGYLEKKHTVQGFESSTVDLRDVDRVKDFSHRLQTGVQIDVILHLASKLMSASDTEKMDIFYDNVRITESVIELARSIKPKKLINMSSMAVYPTVDGTFSETSQIKTSCNTDCLYGLSKFCGENLIDFMLGGLGILIAHLRVSQIIGQGMRTDRVVPVMLKELAEKNTITVLGNGERVTNFIHIDKLISILGLFVEQDFTGVYNVGSENVSYYDLALKLIQENGNERSRIVKMDGNPGAKFQLSVDKLAEALRERGLDPSLVCGVDRWG